jgi:hypothetical protein
MKAEDVILSKEQIRAKYPQGSPDYPTHEENCPCSGCWASWIQWRSGREAVLAEQERLLPKLQSVWDASQRFIEALKEEMPVLVLREVALQSKEEGS